MKTLVPLRLVGIGCGARTRTYLTIAARLPHLYRIEGAADPIGGRVARVREACGSPEHFRSFAGWRELLAAERFADVAVIGTQDSDHKAACLAAMEKGYDILLEKPIAPNLEDTLLIERRAAELGRKVLICHVLRYTPFYRKVKEIIASGAIGEIVSLNAMEGVIPWHQAHSYVRGHWAVTEKASPMILGKCCHDLDIIAWLFERPCRCLSSYGGLSHFTKDHAPAGAPPRCTDGCPVGASCQYNASLYATVHRTWLDLVMDGAADATEAEVLDWLRGSPWGRCVYRCDNTAVDHQVVAMEFAGGGTATFTMTAFEYGRQIEVFGTRGVLRGGENVLAATGSDIVVRLHGNNEIQQVRVASLAGGYQGHGGGDAGLVLALHEEMRKPSSEAMSTSLAASVRSHAMAFAAEASRLNGEAVNVGR